MEIQPRHLCELETPAPALNRGLGVLALLGREAPLTLEALGTRLDLPRGSLFRLLETLVAAGLVRKTPEKLYEPRWMLAPLAEGTTPFRQRIAGRLPELARETGCTAEWYEPCAEGMSLVLQEHPETETRVVVKPGYLRLWGVEFEAVTRLGYAFAPQAPRLEPMPLYTANGVKGIPSLRELDALLERDRAAGQAHDACFNTNGVRRHAAAALREGSFLGVVALAETVSFPARNRARAFLRCLASAVAA
jgi:DNA-binding IclR family transcriptional regulator